MAPVSPVDPLLSSLLELLNRGHYYKLSTLSKALNSSETIVQQALQKLEAYAVPLTWRPHEGYHLETPIILLDARKLRSYLPDLALHLELAETLPSTNDYLCAHANQECSKIQICLAETQTAGKGRFTRGWYSPFGVNLYLSIIDPIIRGSKVLAGLSIVVGLAICQALESFTNLPSLQPKIKWPNDIICNNRKLAGILLELSTQNHTAGQIIMGLGINVNMSDTNNQLLSQPWTSLFQLTHTYHERNRLGATVIATLHSYLCKFALQGFVPFILEWQKRDYLKDRQVTIALGSQTYTGRSLGIDVHGHLLIKDLQGQILSCAAGEATILK